LTYIRRKSKIKNIGIDMGFTKESAVEKAKSDLAKRLKVNESDIRERSVDKKDFPDMSLGAAATDERF
jgi:hypothetical protein